MADPGFPRRGGANHQGGCANPLFGQNFPENCMEMKEFGLRVGRVFLATLRSANGKICGGSMKFFLWNGTFNEFSEFRRSDKSLNHELVSIKDPLCYLCLCGTEVECWFHTQEIACSNTVTFCSLFQRIL